MEGPRMALALWVFGLLGSACCVSANIFEYQVDAQPLRPCELQRERAFRTRADHVPQCAEDGSFQPVQCRSDGRSCWCVGADGSEVPGSRQPGRPVACLSFCQLHRQQVLLSGYLNSTAASYLPQCLGSGEYAPAQCDLRQEQCWCVDAEGMEVYGTRQRGRPMRCPRSCEIRTRRLLHGVGGRSPPQCAPDGGFLPVQCKFVNTTDMMVFDLVHSYNRFPDAFMTFRAFQSRFPEVSGYCHCADSQGRELAETGLELLLDEIYDTIFAGLGRAPTFADTTLYRILQRRFLALQLVLSGRFRCPTKCEVEQFTATSFGHPYVPSCLRNGAFQAAQCQRGGPCWCADAQGVEVPGTRRQDAALSCAGGGSCSSERRRALSRLRFGPSGDLSLRSVFTASEEKQASPRGARWGPSCPPAIRELFVDSGILRPMVAGQSQQPSASGSLLPEAIRGIFPSRELARLALRFTTNPKRLQQNLFGGKFLANVGKFNLSGALGTRGSFNFSQFFQRLGLPGFQSGGGLVDSAKPLPARLDSNPAVETPGAAEKDSAMNKTLVGSFGFEVNIQENQNALKSLASLLDLPEFLLFLQRAISVPEDIARDLGDVMEMVLRAQGCEQAPGGLFVPSCTAEGGYEEAQCFAGECWCVDSEGKELPGSRARGRRPRCPTECEKQRARMLSLSGSQPAGSSLLVPSCTAQGHFLPVQCSDAECYCVDAEGQAIPGTRSARGRAMQCPTPCQLRAERAFLGALRALPSNSSTPSTPSGVYIPQCGPAGRWRSVQCDGPPEQAFEWYTRWRAQSSRGQEPTAAELLTVILSYREAASGSFRGFIQRLYEAGQQGVFPALAGYSSLQDVPLAALEGSRPRPGGNILLEPYLFWQVLSGQLSRYPGPYSDFSAPLAHLDLRTCWCVDEDGQELEGTRTGPSKAPACPGACAEAKLRVLQLLKATEAVVLASSSSPFPLGESFLAAKGIRLTDEELALPPRAPPREALLEPFLSGSDYALRLAAQSTFDFYQSRGFSPADSPGASRRRSSPYVPQCDAFGRWEPVQCHTGTGTCWCVGEQGVPASLTARSTPAPQCPSTCERGRASGLLSGWKLAGSQRGPSPSDLFIPTCLQTGAFARLQASEAGIWCVDQASGEGTPPRTNGSAQCPGLCEEPQSGVLSRKAGPGDSPACGAQDGALSPVQCDPARGSCWCVLGSGEEVPGTRVAGRQPACESPQCPLPFNVSDVASGVILCEPGVGPDGAAVQLCQLLCLQGYRSAFPPGRLVCSPQGRRWLSAPPQPRACQRLQLGQTLQTRAQFQLRLPPGKMCSADYAGLLRAFQVFVADELTARGFCQVQVQTLGTPVSLPICDDSAVRVECLTPERLGVNVTWKLQLKDAPPASLPDLRDVEEALVGKGLAGRFADLIRAGEFRLHLDGKTFPADTSIRFLQGDSVGTSPGARYGCLEGFHLVTAPGNSSQDLLGCVRCPEGSYSQDEQCVPCPAGSYQEWAGSVACTPCPAGTTTSSAGAFSPTHCVTDCQRNEVGLRCDQDGQYRASQRDGDSGEAFCVDGEGRRLPWSETEAPLTDAQCLMMRKFEKAPESKVIFAAAAAEGVRSDVPGSGFPLVQCLAGCASDPACGFLTVSVAGAEVSCDFYAWTSDNVACAGPGQGADAAQSSTAARFGSPRCQVTVRGGDQGSPAVYLKKGQEFSTRSQKSFELTGFQNVLSGVYSSAEFSGPGTSLTEVHLFCLLACDRDACCDGFILAQVRGGPTVCGLLSSPDVLLCHVRDWRDPSMASANATCPGVTYDQGSRQVTLRLGGQEFKGPMAPDGTRDTSAGFQQVYLWKDSDMGSRSESVGCRRDMEPRSAPPSETDPTTQLFSPVDLDQVIVRGNRTLPSRQHWLFKHLFSPQQANLWCLSRCAQEPSFCQLAETRDSAPLYFTCTLYPEAQVCDDVLEPRPSGCRLILPHRPSALFRKKVLLKDTVKNFYMRLPFQKLTGISIRSKVSMPGKSISNGFFECERRCDLDPCCSGFGFLNVSQLTGGEVTCLTLNSLGLQTCSEESGGTWQILDCGSPDTEVRTYPFGWYQKPGAQNGAPRFCPAVALQSLAEKVTPDTWQSLAPSTVVLDPSIRNFDVAHVSMTAAGDFPDARDLCLWECSRHQACQVTALQTRPGALRCVFYPDTQICTHSLQAQYCQLLLREEATHIYRKPNAPLFGSGTSAPAVTITPHGQLLGRSQVIRVGISWKQVDQFLGVPYAAPPLGENRFRAPEPSNWTGSWAAARPRATCWQPGIATPTSSGVSEDCLYLNVFVPQNLALNASVLLFFHNSMEAGDGGSPALDGSFLAATGNLLVVTAGYRVGVFGFLSSGSGEVSGNWGLLDQAAALTWVQTHIAAFGGDPRRVTLAADRGGADVASLHLLTAGADGGRLFQRAVLMGGSALSPAAVISPERARQQAAALAKEVGCPSSSIRDTTSCLRQTPANVLNDAQTKLLAVSGPFHHWAPVVDGRFLREAPASALQRAPRASLDLLLGASQDDGLISRAKAVKQFEERQGRTSSKTAFYRALQNSLGGESGDAGVQAAASWYYSLEHSADDYASFSRALENATRDYFITCPVIDMAAHWARRPRGSVFLYYAPQSYSRGSLELLPDAQYAFGLPLHPAYEGQFTLEEKSTSLKIMQYFSNFIRSGNPNYPHEFSRKEPEFAVPWPDFVPGANGENYKELSALLPNRRGLKKADCSFWSKYIRSLKTPADEAKDGLSAGSEEEDQPADSGLREDLPGLADSGSKSYSK